MKDIRIAGAGIAGLTAAINLAGNGFKVRVFEKERNVGTRFNGDFEGIENWTTREDALRVLKGMGIKANFMCKPTRNMEFFDCRMKEIRVRLKRPFYYLTKRGGMKGSIDCGLKEQALDAGAKLAFGRGLDLRKADIVATGPKGTNMIIRGVTFSTSNRNTVKTIVDDRLAPKGYAYLLVQEGKATLATVMFRDFRNSKTYLDRSLERFRGILDIDMKDSRGFTGHGNFFGMKNYSAEGRLFTGECAGLQDFLFGFGMRYAMMSGFLAAKSIIEGTDYNNLVKENLSGLHKASLVNRFFFEAMGNRGRGLFLKCMFSSKNPVAFQGKRYNFSAYKRAVYPFIRAIRKEQS